MWGFFLRDSGSEFQTVGPKTEKDLFPKVSKEKLGTVSREVSRERSALEHTTRRYVTRTKNSYTATQQSWIMRGLFVAWLLNVPATCQCISGTDLLRQV